MMRNSGEKVERGQLIDRPELRAQWVVVSGPEPFEVGFCFI